jgi:hypothetical protein
MITHQNTSLLPFLGKSSFSFTLLMLCARYWIKQGEIFMAVSLRASEEGLKLVDQERRERGWMKLQDEWIEAAGLAPASFKRFWLGHAIQRDKFIAICDAVAVDWRRVTDAPARPESEVIKDMKIAMADMFNTTRDNKERIEAAKAYAYLVIAEQVCPAPPLPVQKNGSAQQSNMGLT